MWLSSGREDWYGLDMMGDEDVSKVECFHRQQWQIYLEIQKVMHLRLQSLMHYKVQSCA